MKTTPRDSGKARRAFSLIEAVAVVVIIAIAAPPASMMLTEAARARRDAVNSTRALWFATAMLEHVLADVQSDADGRGFEALGDAMYLDDADDGLAARMSEIMEFYAGLGLSAEVEIGGLVSHTGIATGDEESDVFRNVGVVVRWQRAAGGVAETRIGALVTEL